MTAPVVPTRAVHVFVSSPRDVANESAVAVDVVRGLEAEFVSECFLRSHAWDPEGPHPLWGDRSPQASVNAQLPLPSQCDIVVVIVWGRMGTPLPVDTFRKEDGEPFDSGTEWEYEDALRAHQRQGLPRILVYFKEGEPPASVDLSSKERAVADAQEAWAQKTKAEAFRERILKDVGKACFTDRADFRDKVTKHLRTAVKEVLATPSPSAVPSGSAAPPLWSGSPFPGLRAFTDADARIFVGREHEVDQLVERVDQWPLVAVVGASGAGKSSLVGAGLLPRLADPGRAGRWQLPHFDQGRWHGLYMTPGTPGTDPHDQLTNVRDPLLIFARGLADLTGQDPAQLAAALRTDPESAVRLLTAVLRDGTYALLVVDQLEELFTSVSAERREPFVALLRALVTSGRVHVVATVRADFFDRWMQLESLTTLLRENRVFPLSAPVTRLREMIVQPAALAGLQFEDGLVDTLLGHLGRDQASLPLLAYALQELYERKTASGVITGASYTAIGGVHGAIGSHADAEYQNVDEEARQAFAPVFAELTQVDEQGSVTSRRAALDVVAPDQASQRLVEALTHARLLTIDEEEPGRPVVRVAHDALFEHWKDLRELVDARKLDLRVISSLRTAAAEWNAEQRAEIFLWGQKRLDRLDDARAALAPSLDEKELAFIDASRDKSERDALDGQDASLYRKQLEEQAPERLLRRAEALLERGEDPELAVLLATASFARAQVAPASTVLRRALRAHTGRDHDVRRRHDAAVQGLSATPREHQWISAGGEDMRAIVWSADDEARQHVLTHERPVTQAVFSSTSSAAFTVCSDGSVRVWRLLPDGTQAATPRLPVTTWRCPSGRRPVVFGPASDIGVSVDKDGTAWVWALDRDEPCSPLPHDEPIRDVAVAPQGGQLLSGGVGGAFLWRPAGFTGGLRKHPVDVRPSIDAVAWSVTGCIATAGSGLVLVQDGDLSRRRELPLDTASKSVTSLEFSPDGRWLLARTLTEIVVWDVADEAREAWRLTGWVRRLAWRPGTSWIAVATGDQVVQVWDVATAQVQDLFEHEVPVEALAFSPDGALLTGDLDGALHVWPAAPELLLDRARRAVGGRELDPEQERRQLQEA